MKAWGYSVQSLLMCLLVFISGIVSMSLIMHSSFIAIKNLWGMQTIYFVIWVGLTLLINRSWGKCSWRQLGFCSAPTRELARAMGFGLLMGIVSTVGETLFGLAPIPVLSRCTTLQLVVFTWVYASFREELLTRGLIWAYLANSPVKNWQLSCGPLRWSGPTVLSAVYFAAMHFVLFLQKMPARAVLYIVAYALVVGLFAGTWREKQASLWPPILLHAAANVGSVAMMKWL